MTEQKPRYPAWTLTATMLASSLAFIDGSVTNVALAAIGKSFGGSAGDLQWTINAYMLPLSALLLLGGAAGDHFGRRRIMMGGIALFALASVLCTVAQSLPVLLAARGLQGLGAAMLMPNSLAILGNAFSGEARGRAIGTWASAGAIAAAIGPPLGGWLIDTVGWRAIFAINLPVSVAAIFVALRFVEENGTGQQPLDWWGAAFATLALGASTWALTLWSSHHVASPSVWVGVAVGLFMLASFLSVEHHRGERAMMPLALFGSRIFVGLTLLAFLLYGALGGMFVLLPYVLILGGGYTPLQAGLSLLPFAVLIGTMSRLAGRLTERTGPRWPLTIGPIVAAAGFALMTRLDPALGYRIGVAPGIVLVALGMAAAVAPLTSAVLGSVDPRHTGTASGFNSAIARTGGLIATALSGAVIANEASQLLAAFHGATAIGAGVAFASGAVAFLTLPKGRLQGKADELVGGAQSAMGKAIGDEGMQAAGAARKVAGEANQIFGNAKDALNMAAGGMSEAIGDGFKNSGELTPRGIDGAVETVRTTPVLSLLAAAAFGYVLALALHR